MVSPLYPYRKICSAAPASCSRVIRTLIDANTFRLVLALITDNLCGERVHDLIIWVGGAMYFSSESRYHWR